MLFQKSQLQVVFNKLEPIFYCTCDQPCRIKACMERGYECPYLNAKTRRQLSEAP